MPLLPTTGNKYLDSLTLDVAAFAAVLPRGPELADLFLHHALVLAHATAPAGLVVSHAVAPVEQTQVLAVSSDILSQLEYADLAAYQAALSAPGFVHADDLDVVNAHIRNALSAPYDARLKRASGTYVKWRIWGATFLSAPNLPAIRVSLLVKL